TYSILTTRSLLACMWCSLVYEPPSMGMVARNANGPVTNRIVTGPERFRQRGVCRRLRLFGCSAVTVSAVTAHVSASLRWCSRGGCIRLCRAAACHAAALTSRAVLAGVG